MSLPAPKPGILDIAPYVPGKAGPAGKKVIKLSSNESPLGPSPKAVEAYKACADKLSRYPDGNATLLREAIAHAHGLDASRIVCGAGSDELIGLLCHAYVGAGDNILMTRHGFLMYKIYAQAAGADTVMAEETSLTASVDNILKVPTPRTKIVFIANPNNPTGTYISGAELKRLHAGLPSHVLLVVDAAYAEYVQKEDYSPGLDLAIATGNTVMLRTFSKIYALPALRIGWGLFPAGVADVLGRIRSPFNLSSPAIAAGAAAVEDKDHVARSVEHNNKWLPWLAKELTSLGCTITPSVGNFVLAEVGLKAPAIIRHLANEGIMVREMVPYGLPNHIRITVGLEDENKALIAALRGHV